MGSGALNKSFSAASVVLAINVTQSTVGPFRGTSVYVLSYIAAEHLNFLGLEPFKL